MKIGIPSEDGKSISGHFGRTKAFQVIQIKEGKITGMEHRQNSFTGHAMGNHHVGNQGAGHHQHSHRSILNGLNDCEIIIAKGMGKRLYDDLQGAGKEVFITKIADINSAVEHYLQGRLDNNTDVCCSGH